ncbi:MAG TPA: flavodoxin family protein [Burkholderiales bacterium]|nr:flavodoxin family protein [Burkholderiales bacterium]
MTAVVVVYHSGYGHTGKQARAVCDGVKSVAGTVAQLVAVADVDRHWNDLTQADAIIFGAPTYMGSISAEFKKFMEASSKLWFTQEWKDKLAAGFTNSASLNGDKLSSLLELSIFAAQHSMIWVSLGLLPANNSKSQRNDLNRMGSYLGAMAQSDSDVDADVAPPSGDLETARHLGRRVAEVAARFSAGRR